eukprot:2759805-Amphidinium_carterae.1
MKKNPREKKWFHPMHIPLCNRDNSVFAGSSVVVRSENLIWKHPLFLESLDGLVAGEEKHLHRRCGRQAYSNHVWSEVVK